MSFKTNYALLLFSVLPWLYVGTANLAKKSYELTKLGFTHVLNVTDDVENFHVAQFVYMKIPIQDSEKSSFNPYFSSFIDFIARVESLKGKVH